MKEIADKLVVCSQSDYEGTTWDQSWCFVLAAKYPWHAKAVGQKLGATHPEYLIARRGSELILNIVDAPDPKFFAMSMMDEAVTFIRAHRKLGEAVVVACNQGRSRSPTIAMLAIAPRLPSEFEAAEDAFTAIYPDYAPAAGVRGFAQQNWSHFHAPA